MAAKANQEEEPAFPWHLGVYDAHCHPTDTVPSIDKIKPMKTRALTIMATRSQDQSIVADFANRLGQSLQSVDSPEKIQGHLVPCFGWHPWFSHQLYDDSSNVKEQENDPSSKDEHYKKVLSPLPEDEDFINSLPEPRPLSALIDQTRNRLRQYPFALVGEIGLDRAFRLPGLEMLDNGYEKDPALTPGGREGRRLSPYRVDMDHQRRVLTSQLNLAGEMGRAVSVHGVAAHGIIFETLQDSWRGHEKVFMSKRERKRKPGVDSTHDDEDTPGKEITDKLEPKPFPPRICLHSYSGPADTLRHYLHPAIPAVIFFSFSRLVNFSSPTSNKAVDVIKAVPDDRILAESDLHAAGERMDDLMEDIIRTICQIKGWSLEKGVQQLAANWKHYVFGEV